MGLKMIDLRQGDCLELMKNIPDGSVDLVLTDPPYGIGFKSNHRKEKYNEIKNDKSLEWLEKYVGECFRYADIIKANRTGNKNHPTEKPVDLLETFIKNSSDENAVVFDGFMGSGSTGVACVNTNRDFIGIELDKGYFSTAKERIEKAIIAKQKGVL